MQGGGEPWGLRRASHVERRCRSGAGGRRLPRRFSPAFSSLRSLREGCSLPGQQSVPLTVCRVLGPQEHGVRRPAANKAHSGSLTQRAWPSSPTSPAQRPSLLLTGLVSLGPLNGGGGEGLVWKGEVGVSEAREARAEASLGGRYEATVPSRHSGRLWRTPGKGFGSKFLPRCFRLR